MFFIRKNSGNFVSDVCGNLARSVFKMLTSVTLHPLLPLLPFLSLQGRWPWFFLPHSWHLTMFHYLVDFCCIQRQMFFINALKGQGETRSHYYYIWHFLFTLSGKLLVCFFYQRKGRKLCGNFWKKKDVCAKPCWLLVPVLGHSSLLGNVQHVYNFTTGCFKASCSKGKVWNPWNENFWKPAKWRFFGKHESW